jgi:uncharacterized protein (DUF58 family)
MVLGLTLLVLGRRYSWSELVIIGVCFGVCLVVAVGFTFGRVVVEVSLDVVPQRLFAGSRSAAQVSIRNAHSRRSSSFRMELRVGQGVAEFEIPSLSSGEEYEEVFVLPTSRRAIVPVGPCVSVKSDPLGLLRRSVVWTRSTQLFVHPPIVPLGGVGAGMLRDLEGIATNELSAADVAFHTLREYQPGDDRRFIHWLSTAKAGTYMVRQFVDTRRIHVGVVVDGDERSYGSDHEFDLAVSVAASLGARTLGDGQELSMVAGGDRVPCGSATAMLDSLAGVAVGGRDRSLAPMVEQLVRSNPGTSLAVLVTGSVTKVADVRSAATHVPVDVRTIVVRTVPGEAPSLRPIGSIQVVTVGELADLPHLLWAVARS